MQYLGYRYTNNLFVYLKFRFNRASCIFSGTLIKEKKRSAVGSSRGTEQNTERWGWGVLPKRGASGLALNVEHHLQRGRGGERHIRAATRITIVGAVLVMAGQSGEEADKPALILHVCKDADSALEHRGATQSFNLGILGLWIN